MREKGMNRRGRDARARISYSYCKSTDRTALPRPFPECQLSDGDVVAVVSPSRVTRAASVACFSDECSRAMSYLDDWYAVVARNIGGGSTKRFFHQGYGDMVSAARIYADVIDSVTRGEATAPLKLRWGDKERVEPGVTACFGPGQAGVPTLQEAEFDSPAAAFLPERSKTGRLLFVWRDSPSPPRKIAVHLPTTGDQFYYFRKQIALELLKHDIASVILMWPYYNARKPEGQYAHVLPSVSSFITQICAGVMESAAIAAWAAETYPGAHTVFTGVSLGGSVANVAAIVAAAAADAAATQPRARVGAAPVVATSSATSFLTGVLHNRIAWDVLAKAPSDAAADLRAVLASAPTETEAGGAVEVRKENGDALNETEAALAATMECLSLPKIVRLMEARRREGGKAMPELGSVVQVSADGDRFVGKHQEELFGVMRGLCNRAERRDIKGGHLSMILFHSKDTIVPAIVAAFDELDREEERGDRVERAPAGVPEAMTRA